MMVHTYLMAEVNNQQNVDEENCIYDLLQPRNSIVRGYHQLFEQKIGQSYQIPMHTNHHSDNYYYVLQTLGSINLKLV